MINLNSADKLMLKAAVLDPARDELMLCRALIKSVKDWDYFIDCAIHSGTGPLLHKNFLLISDNNFIPRKVKSNLQQTYFKTLSRNVNIYKHFREVIPAFAMQNISVVALKGIYLAEKLYKDIGLRRLSDIDLLVRSEDIGRAGQILIDAGYSSVSAPDKRDFSKNKDYGFTKGEVFVELHQHIHPPYEDFYVDINEYWQRAQKTNIDGQDILVLSDVDMLQHLCIHLFIHIRNGHFSLINFSDIAGLLKTQLKRFDWDFFRDMNKKYNCTNEIGAILLIAEKYLNIDIPYQLTHHNVFFGDTTFEERFVNILHGTESKWTTDDYKMHNFRKARGLRNKLHYLLQELFPLRSFMLRRYHPRFPMLFFLYYPYRLVSIGLKALVFVIKKK